MCGNPKSVQASMLVHFSGPQDGVRELGEVDGVGEFLGFQGKGAAECDDVAVLVNRLAVTEEIAAVELEAGLVGINFQHSSRRRAYDPGVQAEAAGAGVIVYDPVVVVAVAVADLLIVGIYELAYGPGLAEIHRTAVYDHRMSKRYQLVIHGRHAAGRDLHDMVKDVAFPAPLQVEEGMMRQIDGGGSVGGGFELDFQIMEVGQGVAYADGLVAGKTAQAVGMHHLQLDALGSLFHDVP